MVETIWTDDSANQRAKPTTDGCEGIIEEDDLRHQSPSVRIPLIVSSVTAVGSFSHVYQRKTGQGSAVGLQALQRINDLQQNIYKAQEDQSEDLMAEMHNEMKMAQK